ncbi:HipA family kinase [Elizabethkingia anophelis]|uniref:HipA family kinase n=1 Tax=Elizabethkingia anophelis TaxID=1117645 RepID=UPI001D6C01A8|nr:HipA family kinase [Elizabethkingia anophelis]EHM7982830.1 hypothetical protein [Elizabethkingia anophelis]EHM8030163.1 hypothetical protein [Elizabethkingia anophelis]EHM8034167.1 hypothetical protein [Elizabethkingia anophelis]EHZ9532917.1 hypothetical protein [Elizabethkingia anophelis]EKU3670827.1 hypothetical protein [Elizabethkingia anophelis]
MKITDDGFSLRKIFALEHLEKFDSGATFPMLIRGVCKETQIKGEYVVKYMAGRIDKDASCRELLGSFLAMQFDLYVPEPVLIEISGDFVNTIEYLSDLSYINNCIGDNFGSEYMPGFIQILNEQTLNGIQITDAVNIFAFDILISNADRRVDKHNLLSDGKRLMIFDHELAFGFLFAIVQNTKPWIIAEEDLYWIKNHIFYNRLKQIKPRFDDFVERLDIIDEKFWLRADTFIPREWQTSGYLKIKKHIAEIKKNKDVFLQQLNNLVI